MRKTILYISQSLDGFIADKNGSVDRICGNDETYISDYGYEGFIKNIDTVVLGYNTYHQIISELSPDKWVYESFQSYVLTSKKMNDTDNIKFVNTPVTELLKKLKSEDGKDIWICGGAGIANQCIKENLIDEYHITTVPVILGRGIRLFSNSNEKIRLKMTETREENGLILAIYKKIREAVSTNAHGLFI